MVHFFQNAFWPNSYAWQIFFIAGLIPLIGLYIFNQNRASSANRAFFMLCMAIFFWMTGQAVVLCSKTESLALLIYRSTTFLGVSLIATLVYYFSVTWLGLETTHKKRVQIAFLGSFFFYAMGLFTPWSFIKWKNFNWGYCPLYGPTNWFFQIGRAHV